ncbi:MAG TPA: AraC family transcriptional regulator [Sphingomonas sp.]|nr:AraC family transcriptional regulator [Sphingomonas sp.]
MLPTVRAVSLSNYVAVARFVGLDPFDLLRRARINPDQLADPEYRLPAASVIDLVTQSAEASGCDSFALLMVECRTFASLGAVSLLLEHQPTVRAMVEVLIGHQRHLNDVLDMRLEDDGAVALIHSGIDPALAQPQATEYAVAMSYRWLSEVTNGRWHPDCVHFRHRAPADLRNHRRVLQCRIEFDAAFDGLSCSSAMLDLANPAASAAMAGHAERLLAAVPTSPPEASVSEKTRHVIHLLIHGGHASVDRVADNLGLHPRMLQRLLDREGATFAGLLNETRRDLALRYLAGAHHSLTAIAELAGYSNQSAFTRWFAAEFGETPAAWRSREHAGRLSMAS